MSPVEPRVSVIMNAFNSSRYLRETLDSLFAQTFTDWELIFWDNQSEDDTLKIIEARPDPRVRIFVAPARMTLADGRNHAMAQARGEWLAYLDHDDLWLPHKLESQLRLVDSSSRPEEIGLVYARTRSFSARGDEGEMIYRYTGRPLPEGRILRILLEEGCVIPLVSAMVHRNAWQRVGPIPSYFKFAEEYWLFVAVAEYYDVRCVQEVCCRYRVHPNSATAKSKALSHIESIQILDLYRSHLPRARYRKRRRVCETLWAVEIMLKEHRIGPGLRKLFFEGSLPFFCRGCFSYFFRKYVRNQRPVS